MVKYKKGDLLEATEDIICHGVNCVGGFGSGVAGQIAKKWPEVRNHYLARHCDDDWRLGDVQFVQIDKRKYVANCATQLAYLPRGKQHVDYGAILRCMNEVKAFAWAGDRWTMPYSIAIPKIGCGLAGGDWEIVKKILEDVFHDYDCTVYEI